MIRLSLIRWRRVREGVLCRPPRPPHRHLWQNSSRKIIGYYIQARDGEMGHVEDFIIDTDTWHIRYMVVDTKNWWPGKKVLVSPRWIQDIRWDDAHVTVDLSRDQIKASPEYDPSKPIPRDYETRLHDHYGRPAYWQ